MADPAATIGRLIDDFPLAWVVSRDFDASLLPLLAERDAGGQVVSLFGHCANRNPLLAAFAADPSGLVLFDGPSGYVSPKLIDRRDWAPTWNYSGLRVRVRVELVPTETAASLTALLDHMEGPAPDRWTVARMGPRYAALLARITAFRCHIEAIDARLKLGQDEGDAEFAQIVDRHPDRALAAWMTAVAERPAPA